MNHASIVSIFHGTCSPEDFYVGIASEVAARAQAISIGGVGQIVVTGGPHMTVARDHAARLLRAVSDARLPFDAANYLADGLTMSDDFDFADQAVMEAIAFVADESRHPTDKATQAALARLK